MRSRAQIGVLLVLVASCGGRVDDGTSARPDMSAGGPGASSGTPGASSGIPGAPPPCTPDTTSGAPLVQPKFLISGQPGASTLVIDDASVYWVNVGLGSNPQTEVKSVLKAGGGFATQYSGPITKTSPLWLDRGWLYFATPDG